MPALDAERAVHHEHAVVDDLGLRREHAKHVQQLVVRGAAPLAEHSRPRGEQRARADRQKAVRRVGARERAAQPIVQPPGGDRDLRRDLGQPRRGLADDHDPGRRAELLRQRIEVVELQPDRRRRIRRRPRETKTEARRQSTGLAVQVGETKGFGRAGDVEQQRVRHDHEEHVDELGARDHVRDRRVSAYNRREPPIRVREPMSESDSKLSAWRRDGSRAPAYLRDGHGRGRVSRPGVITLHGKATHALRHH